MIGRRALLGGLLASASAAGAQSFRVGRAPGFRAGFQFLSVGPIGNLLPQQPNIVARWSAGDIPIQTDNTALATWTDSVGGIAAAQATSANQPKYRASGQSGKPYVQFAGGAQCLATSGTNAALTAMQATTSTVFVVYRNPTSAGTVLGTLIGGNTTAVGGNLWANSAFVGRDWGQNPYKAPLTNTAALETIGVTNRPNGTDGGTTNGGRLYVRGCCVREQGQMSIAGAATGVSIGGSPASSSYGGVVEIYDVIVWNRTLTSPEMKQVEKWARDKYGLPYPWAGLTYFRSFHGNSIASGYQAGTDTFAAAGPTVIASNKGWGYGTWENGAAVGLNWTQLNTTATRDIDPLPAMLGVPVQLHAWEWNNSGRVASTTYSQCTSYFGNRRSAGIGRLVVSTSTDISDSIDTAGQRTDRATYCANIASNWSSFADAYAPLHNDSGASAPIGPEGACPAASPFTPNFSDGQHCATPGYAEYAALVGPSLL